MGIINEKPAANGLINTNIFNNNILTSQKQSEYEREFVQAMSVSGILCPDQIIADSQIHRFASHDKGNKNGWYVFHGMAGAYGDWSQGIIEKWHLKGKGLTKAPRTQIAKQIQASRKALAAEIQRKNLEAAEQAQAEWDSLQEEGHSAYLDRKQVNAFGIRYGGEYIAIPLRDEMGKLWSLQKIWGDGSSCKRFLPGGRKKGCFHIIGNIEDDGAIYIAEGYATGASVHMATNVPVVIAFDAGNLGPVVESIRNVYPSLEIIIAADNDQWKEVNTGKEAAEIAAAKYNCKVVLPIFKKALSAGNKPTDFNDLHSLEGIDAVKAQLINTIIIPFKPILPNGFALKQDGLTYEDDWVCSPIEVVACTRDENNENWGRLVKFKDLDGHQHEKAIPMEMFAGDCNELYSLLLSLGLRIASRRSLRNKLPDYLQGIKLCKSALCASRIGWYKDYFILPEGSIPETDAIYLQSDNSNFVGYKTAGTLEQWQEYVAKPCQGNSRLVFALSCAFAGPLLQLVQAESGGFNLIGNSSIGKSTALAIAASVWGSPKYIQNWKATSNALEAVAEAYNNTLLCLDELGQVSGVEVGEISYMLANGVGKNRLKAKGGLRRKYEWNLLFLSTGEVSVVDKLREANKTAHAGMLARMADIPADAGKNLGLFDTLHHFTDGSSLSHHLKNKAGEYYGTAIRAYLPYLIDAKERLPNVIKQVQEDFFKAYVPAEADGQVRRVAYRFVLVAVAGELSIKAGILPASVGEAYQAAEACFLSWLEERGSPGVYELEEAIKQVRTFFEIHHSTRFVLMGDMELTPDELKCINQAGYKRKKTEGGYDFYVFGEVFRNEICKGYNCKNVCAELVHRNLLIRGSDKNQYVKNQRLPIGNKKIYHLSSAILSEENQEEDYL